MSLIDITPIPYTGDYFDYIILQKVNDPNSLLWIAPPDASMSCDTLSATLDKIKTQLQAWTSRTSISTYLQQAIDIYNTDKNLYTAALTQRPDCATTATATQNRNRNLIIAAAAVAVLFLFRKKIFGHG